LATADINGLDRHGRTALHRAARKGNKSRIEQLVQAGADLEARTRKQGWIPLHVAALNGHAGVLPLLITPATLDALNDNEETPLELAVDFQQLEAAAVLVAAGASLSGSTNGYDAFFIALITLYMDKTSGKLAVLLWDAVKGDPAAGQVLTEAAQRVDGRGQTYLHDAAGKGYQELVTRLLAAGADRDSVDHQGTTPLWQAVEAGHTHLVPLLATPANINLTDHDLGRTALHHAAERGCLELVTQLLAAGANRDTVGGDQATPLWLAASAGHAQLVPLLASPSNVNLAAGASTPFLAAVEHCHYGAAAALLAAGASADCRDRRGRSALALAAHSGTAQDVALLLKALAACPCKKKQQQQQQHQRAALNALLTEAVASLVVKRWDAPRCCQVLEAILDVLGPKVAGAVCVSVQQQIQQEVDRQQQQQQQPGPMAIVDPDVRKWVKEWQGTHVPFSSLGDALLLGWAGAEERLHAARQPLVARLQRQVLCVTNAGQQGQDEEWSLWEGEQKDGEEDCEQQQWVGQHEEAQQQGVREHSEVAGQQQSDQHDEEEQQQGQQQDDESHHQQQECSEEQEQQQEGGHGKNQQGATDSSILAELDRVVIHACLAAAEGREVDAEYWLQRFAGVYLQHLEEGCTRDSTCAESAWCSHSPKDDHSDSPFQALLRMGLSVAAMSRADEECNPDKAPLEVCIAAWQLAQSFQPPQLYAIILGAWVQARRELQQLPLEMAATVVAAVTVAQQQQQL
jgi:ankyrin repeat protein